MSHFHDHNKNNSSNSNDDIKKSIEVIIAGQILTSMIDETISLEKGSYCTQGILIGNREERKCQVSVDNNEDAYEIKHEIQITSYSNFRSSYSLW